MNSYTTLSEAISELKKRGYILDFNLKHNCVECKSMDIKLHPADFIIDEYYRFEGPSNPDDNSILYAISSKDGMKGTLVNAFGVYADSLTNEMVAKLKIAGH